MKKDKNQSDDWNKLRPILNKNYSFSANWEKAIDIFRHRILSHYQFPLEVVVRRKDHEGEGFTIATVISSYIEMLAAFEKGKIYNPGYKPKTDPSFEYSKSGDLYQDYLRSALVFKDHFWRDNPIGRGKEEDKPYSAKDFYENVRCGLVHEGRTKNGWKINAKKSDDLTSNIFIVALNDEKSLLRSVMH